MATLQERQNRERQKLDRSHEAREEVWARRVGHRKRRVWRRRLLNAFLFWHCCAIILWLLPANFPVVRTMLPPDNSGAVRAYMVTTNFMQSWQMFSPNPDDMDRTMEALVRHADGTTQHWAFPRVANMNYTERYRRERLRKWIEVADHNDLVWPALARYAARANNADPHNPPVAVLVMEHVRRVPPPGGRAKPFQAVPLFQMRIVPEMLR